MVTSPSLNIPPSRFGRASGMPWDVGLAQNQLLNRVAMDAAGPIPWEIALSRTKYERMEHILSAALYLLVGIGLPVFLEKIFNDWFTCNKLAPKYGIDPEKKPLRIPFEALEHHGLEKLQKMSQAERNKILGQYGITTLTPQLAKTLKLAKCQIILVDLLLFAIKGQAYYFGKNWMTEKWSGKSGYSGILNYANDDYLKKKSENYQKITKFLSPNCQHNAQHSAAQEDENQPRTADNVKCEVLRAFQAGVSANWFKQGRFAATRSPK